MQHKLKICLGVAVTLLLMALTPVSAGAETMVVVSSTSPAARVGMSVDRDQKIQVSSGQRVTFLTQSGRILEVRGPFSGRIKGKGRPASPAILKRLERMIMRTGGGEADLGGVRGDVAAVAPDTTVPGTAVEVMRGGTWCVIADMPPELLRPTFQRSAEARVTNLENDDTGATKWGPWQTRAKWPDGLPIYDGATYSVSVDGDQPASFTLRLIPDDVSDPVARLNWMASAGCEAQVKTAIKEIEGKL